MMAVIQIIMLIYFGILSTIFSALLLYAVIAPPYGKEQKECKKEQKPQKTLHKRNFGYQPTQNIKTDISNALPSGGSSAVRPKSANNRGSKMQEMKKIQTIVKKLIPSDCEREKEAYVKANNEHLAEKLFVLIKAINSPIESINVAPCPDGEGYIVSIELRQYSKVDIEKLNVLADIVAINGDIEWGSIKN